MGGAVRSNWCSTIDNGRSSSELSSPGLTGRPSNLDASVRIETSAFTGSPPSRGRQLSLHLRQHFELVERRRRRQRPFQRGGAGAPRIVGSLFLAHERLNH